MKKFYLETNQVFSWINTYEQLILAMAILEKYSYYLERIVDTGEQDENGYFNFGTRREHQGDISLLDWLENENNIDIKKLKKEVIELAKKHEDIELQNMFADL